jgi:hypothetical protein
MQLCCCYRTLGLTYMFAVGNRVNIPELMEAAISFLGSTAACCEK